jgi:hypothetical protein
MLPRNRVVTGLGSVGLQEAHENSERSLGMKVRLSESTLSGWSAHCGATFYGVSHSPGLVALSSTVLPYWLKDRYCIPLFR